MLSEKIEKLRRFSVEKDLNFEELVSKPNLVLKIRLRIYFAVSSNMITCKPRVRLLEIKSLIRKTSTELINLVSNSHQKIVRSQLTPECIEMTLTVEELLQLLSTGKVYSVWIQRQKLFAPKIIRSESFDKLYSFYVELFQFYEQEECYSIQKVIYFVKAQNIDEAFDTFFVNEFLVKPVASFDIKKNDCWISYSKLTKVCLNFSLQAEQHPECFQIYNDAETTLTSPIPNWLRDELSIYKTWFPSTPLTGQNKYTYRWRSKNETLTVKSLYLEFIGFYCFYREQYFEKFSLLED